MIAAIAKSIVNISIIISFLILLLINIGKIKQIIRNTQTFQRFFLYIIRYKGEEESIIIYWNSFFIYNMLLFC